MFKFDYIDDKNYNQASSGALRVVSAHLRGSGGPEMAIPASVGP